MQTTRMNVRVWTLGRFLCAVGAFSCHTAQSGTVGDVLSKRAQGLGAVPGHSVFHRVVNVSGYFRRRVIRAVAPKTSSDREAGSGTAGPPPPLLMRLNTTSFPP